MINYDVPLNNHRLNANLKGYVFDDKTMLANWFYLTNDNTWYRRECLGQEISLNIKISQDYLSINVIDEDFGQPYDYQAILRNNPEHDIALDVHGRVQNTIKRLSDAGIIEGYVANDYI